MIPNHDKRTAAARQDRIRERMITAYQTRGFLDKDAISFLVALYDSGAATLDDFEAVGGAALVSIIRSGWQARHNPAGKL